MMKNVPQSMKPNSLAGPHQRNDLNLVYSRQFIPQNELNHSLFQLANIYEVIWQFAFSDSEKGFQPWNPSEIMKFFSPKINLSCFYFT